MERVRDRREPRFVIAGAVKAATTWTARQLAKHPQVYMPGPEPHYFSDQHHRGFDWYLSLFSDASEGVVIGEKSADYLAHPLAAGRLAAELPAAQIIVQLRNPVDRAYSDYCMLYRRGETKRPAGDYFRASASDGGRFGARFLNGGLYATHLQRIYDYFPRKQVLVALYDDIAASPQETMARITDHIGVDRIDVDLASTSRENDSSSEMLPLPLRKALRPFKAAARPFRGMAWFKALRGTLAKPIAYPPLDDEAKSFLADFYGRDIEALSRLMKMELSHWLTAAPASGGNLGAGLAVEVVN
jgi:hypothetical protein